MKIVAVGRGLKYSTALLKKLIIVKPEEIKNSKFPWKAKKAGFGTPEEYFFYFDNLRFDVRHYENSSSWDLHVSHYIFGNVTKKYNFKRIFTDKFQELEDYISNIIEMDKSFSQKWKLAQANHPDAIYEPENEISNILDRAFSEFEDL